MNLCELWTEIDAVPLTMPMHDVFERFRNHREWPFLPVVDEEQRVLGVVREYDLKTHAYAQFGRDLVKRHSLRDFLQPTLELPVSVMELDLLNSSAKNTNPDGLVLSHNGKYRAVLLTRAILSLFEQHHRETQVRTAQAQKMEAIGSLAGGIAHDLNNILTPILGYSELMSLMLDRGQPIQKEMVDRLQVSAVRARDIVKHILAFSRHQQTERLHMSLGGVIKDALPLVRSSLPASIDIEMRLNTEEDVVMVNADEMHRIILNLCTNAYHAMRERGGALVIALDRHVGPVRGWSVHEELLPGSYVRLSVSDTGTGINPDLLPRIFEPFFTTKKQGDGTGLGLSIMHGIVTRCQGVVSVESVVGRGSTFHVYLPTTANAMKSSATRVDRVHPSKDEAPLADQPKARILFVDDEYAVTRLASVLLPQYGIAIETENDSARALETFRSRADEFDLLVTDQTMPGLSGVELTREVLQIRPEMPVILCTGYSETVSPEQAKKEGICDYMLKPPDFRKMADSILHLIPPSPAFVQ